MSVDEFVNKHNPFNIYIEFNEYKINYKNIEDFFEYDLGIDNEYIIDKSECIKNNSIYRFQVYPDNSIGFYVVFASTLEKAIKEMDIFLSKKQKRKVVSNE